MFELKSIVRQNIWNLKPYRCARDDYSVGILLDANENSLGPSLPFKPEMIDPTISTTATSNGNRCDIDIPPSYSDTHLERYPDPYQKEIKEELAKLRNLASTDHFFLGVGSDESIDLIIRVFCVPSKDEILICPPTYGMYTVCAQVNDVGVVKIPLLQNFQLDVQKIKESIRQHKDRLKVIFLCSPGNPTGTLLKFEDMKEILEDSEYNGIVVVDEAYIDFALDKDGHAKSVASSVLNYPNLIVIQTLSKSFGLAGIRLGAAISSVEIAQIFNKTKAPYNISTPTSLLARSALSPEGLSKMKSYIQQLLNNRTELIEKLKTVPQTGKIIGDNDANFVLVQILNKEGQPCNDTSFFVYKQLAETKNIVVRFRGSELWCDGCLRITVGTQEENRVLIERMKEILLS